MVASIIALVVATAVGTVLALVHGTCHGMSGVMSTVVRGVTRDKTEYGGVADDTDDEVFEAVCDSTEALATGGVCDRGSWKIASQQANF